MGRTVPIANVIIDAAFFAEGKQRYQFFAGQTDVGGQLVARYDHFDRERTNNALQNLMDYNTRLEDCTSQLRLHVPSLEELMQRLKAVEKWYPELAQPLAERIAVCANGKVKVDDATVQLESGRITPVTMLCHHA